jgi:hypothetical protein
MPRDAIAEWRRALIRREPAYALFLKTREITSPDLSPRRLCDRPPSPLEGEGRNGQQPSNGGIVVQSLDLSKTRPLAPLLRITQEGGDLAQAIRVLQRHNRLLRARFGMGWVDATNFVLGEARRRGTTATLLARALSLRLRTEPAT